MSKYIALKAYLQTSRKREITLSFEEIARIINNALPISAFKYSEWWANENPTQTMHSQCNAWQEAGFKAFPDLQSKSVIFKK